MKRGTSMRVREKVEYAFTPYLSDVGIIALAAMPLEWVRRVVGALDRVLPEEPKKKRGTA